VSTFSRAALLTLKNNITHLISVYLCETMKNLPNLISISRGVAALALLFTTAFSLPFWVLYVWCGVSDVIDGPLARRLKVESRTGAAIDSIADLFFVVFAAIKIIPALTVPSWIWWVFGMLACIQILRMSYLYCKERNFAALHDVPNKIIGVMLYLVPYVIMLF